MWLEQSCSSQTVQILAVALLCLPLQFGQILGAMADSKFQSPKPSTDVDAGKFMKLAQRVERTLTTKCLYIEPKQIDPDKILVSPYNRLGANPNTKHMHFGILKSFWKNSFDRTRPAIGICVEIKSVEGIRKVLEHNRKFTEGNKLLPPILDLATRAPVYVSLACTHLNLAFRAIKNGTHSPVCNLRDLMDHETLKQTVLEGHKWWVLPEDLPKDQQVDISVWRNQDQNENQATHELEILQTIQHTAETFLQAGSNKVCVGDLVAAAQKRNPTKVSPVTWMSLTKYYIGFLENGKAELVEDLSSFHSETVDPKELSVSLKFYTTVAGEVGLKDAPETRHFLTTTQYNTEKILASPSGPSFSQFLETSQIVAFSKKTDQVLQLEKTICNLKEKYLPVLEKSLGKRMGRLELTVYMGLLIRCMFSKAWPVDQEPRVTLPIGRFCGEKVQELGRAWAASVDLKHPSIAFAAEVGLETKDNDEHDSLVSVDLENLRDLKKHPSEPECTGPKFKRGDEVTVIRKMTWALPQKSNPNFRKDLLVGAKGTIEGWADGR